MVVIAMMFILVFIALGVALYSLLASQKISTETERTDVKAFNVAEAGIDAGMLELKLAWPTLQTDPAPTVDDALLKEAVQGDANLSKLWDPTTPSDFINVVIYDNRASTDPADYATDVPPDPDQRVYWDSNGDGKMFVDSTGDVGNDRHRILIQAQKQKWELTFPDTLAFYAGTVDSNGQGLSIVVEKGNGALYDVHDSQHKGIDPGPNVNPSPTSTSFDSIFNDALIAALMGLATTQGTYCTTAAAAQTLLNSGTANGKVCYLETGATDFTIELTGGKVVGTEVQPVVMIIDTRSAPSPASINWDQKGNSQFWGILVTIGNNELRGTCNLHGAVYCSGTLLNKGKGSDPEINYNDQVIFNINRDYTISVNIVPNTWEEYTLQKSSS
jgi:hypothetical protein